jgi:hypothetical protein
MTTTAAFHTFHAYDDLVDRVRAGALGPDPATRRIAVAFTTRQAVRHDGRGTGYRNEVLSLRLAEAVGSCAVEPGELPDSALDDCVGADVAHLLEHPLLPVRVAALDAYLLHVTPHTPEHGARPVPLPAGSSLEKSRARARAVVELLDLPAGATSSSSVSSTPSSKRSVRAVSATCRATSRAAPPSGASPSSPMPSPPPTAATPCSSPA